MRLDLKRATSKMTKGRLASEGLAKNTFEVLANYVEMKLVNRSC